MTEPTEPKVLNQLETHWQRVAMALLWHFVKDQPVHLRADGIEQMHAAFPNGLVLKTHGHRNSLEFQLITPMAKDVLMATVPNAEYREEAPDAKLD